MHEFTLINGIMKKIETIAMEQNAQKIEVVRFKLGSEAHISAEHFCEHFEQAAKGTAAEGAGVEIEMITDWSDPLVHEIVLDSLELPTHV